MSASQAAASIAAWNKFGENRTKRHSDMLKIQAAAKARYEPVGKSRAANAVRCPDHRNGGATRCPRGGAALQQWQKRQWEAA